MDENLTAAQIRLDQAREAIQAAELLADNGLARSSIERSYYAAFHAASALLASRGIYPSTHDGTISMLALHFVKAGALSEVRRARPSAASGPAARRRLQGLSGSGRSRRRRVPGLGEGVSGLGLAPAARGCRGAEQRTWGPVDSAVRPAAYRSGSHAGAWQPGEAGPLGGRS